MADRKPEEEAKAKAAIEAKAKAETDSKTGAEPKTAVTVRHKTPNRHYRCAGLALTKTAQTHMVTEAQLKRLRRDPWVETAEVKE